VQDIPVHGWRPADTKIHISDITGLISKLGGQELYGDDPSIALRELIQNASDAIRARRRLESRDDDWGMVTVRLLTDGDADWLEVEDDGIGMSEQVIRHYLLSFGSSYWGSELMRTEFPGLLAKGLNQTGRYGIGFFSLSILSDNIRILTRRFNAGYDKTYSLEFASGLWSRPILRLEPSAGSELRDGGTRVRVRLKTRAAERYGLLYAPDREPFTLAALCGQIAPAVDVNLLIMEPDGKRSRFGANEWRTLSGHQLYCKLREGTWVDDEIGDLAIRFAENIRPITDGDQILGRMFLVPSTRYVELGDVTVGGLAATELQKICGVIQGTSIRASREEAMPIADEAMMSKWATEQAKLRCEQNLSPEEQVSAGHVIYRLGGDVRSLKIVLSSDGWLDAAEVAEWVADKSVIWVAELFEYEMFKRSRPNLELNESVLCVDFAGGPILSPRARDTSDRIYEWPRIENNQKPERFYLRGLDGLLMEILATSWKESLEKLDSQVKHARGDPRVIAEMGRDGSFSLKEKLYQFQRSLT